MAMRKRNVLFTAAVLGAALTIALTGTAYASTTATVATPGTTSWSNPGSGALLKTDAQCSSGLVSGAGVNVTGSGTQQQIDGIHAMEIEPSTDGTNPAGSGATDPTYALGYGATGGQGGGSYTVQPFAVCFSNATINHTQVVVTSVNGPTGMNAMQSATATCPMNTILLGGGGQSKLASNLSVHLIADFPSSNSGAAAADGTTNPTSWTAYALNGGMSGTGNTITAYAICSGSGINVSGITVTVKHTHVSGPNTASSTATATTSGCGTAGTLISGAASVSGGDPTTGTFTKPGSQGDHLDGDYPSNSSGTPASNGSATANWTAIGHAGGMSSTGNGTDVWGMCMN
jgi:hypothetical protein